MKEPRRNDIHHNIQCDGCGIAPIRGIRYKCGVCADFDLCATCEAKDKHPINHPMIKLKVATSLEVQASYGPPSSEEKKFQVETKETKESKKPRPVAHFVRDVNLPDGAKVTANAVLLKSWEFTNPSTEIWPEGSKLIFLEGNRELLGEVEEFVVPLATPGQTVEVQCPIQIPSQPGKYQTTFQLATKDHEPFEGHRCWVELTVSEEEKKSPPVSKQTEPKSEEKSQVKPQVQDQPKPQVQDQPKPQVQEQPKPQVQDPKPVVQTPIESKVEHKNSLQDQIDQNLKAQYKNQLTTLEGMGFGNSQLNLYLIHKYKGNLEQTVSWLIEMGKTR